MPTVNSTTGPVAVTGASGYIGSHCVKNLVEHGYSVRACVRDATRTDKTAHLLALNGNGVGSVEVVSADMTVPGAYDEPFAGCCAVLHVAADLATDPTYGEMSPDRMYAGLFDATQNVLDSIEKAGTVKRLVYTSSTAAVMGPQSEGAPQPHIYSEDDWSGGTYESLEERWQGGWTIEKNAYAVGKVECEKMTYAWGDKTGIDVVTSCPCHVLGPLLCKAHDTIWQHRLGEIFAGRYSIDMMWNICDVRDIAQSQRLMLETEAATNGTRYMNVSPGDVGALDSPDSPNRASGEPTARELVEMLQTLYPDVEGIGGPKPMTPDRNSPLARCHKAEQELGLRCHIIMDTLKDTIDTLIAFGAIDEIRAEMAERSKL